MAGDSGRNGRNRPGESKRLRKTHREGRAGSPSVSPFLSVPWRNRASARAPALGVKARFRSLTVDRICIYLIKYNKRKSAKP